MVGELLRRQLDDVREDRNGGVPKPVLPVSASELIAADCAASHVRQAGAPGGILGAPLIIVA